MKELQKIKVEKVAVEIVIKKFEKLKKPPKTIEDPSSSKNIAKTLAEYLIDENNDASIIGFSHASTIFLISFHGNF